MKLSKHFSLNEFLRSETGDRLGIDNVPSDDDIENMKMLCDGLLEPIRSMVQSSIFISSGYRSPTLNRQIGGSSTSDHCLGKAADFVVRGKNCRDVAHLIINSGMVFNQLILEYPSENQPNGVWLHISFKEGNKREVLTVRKINGNRVYKRVIETSFEKDKES